MAKRKRAKMQEMNRRWILTLSALLAFGCGGSSSSSEGDSPNLSFTIDVVSQATNLKQLNGGADVAGWNRLTGPSTVNGEAVDVEVLANVAYRNGSGPFFGFVTVERADDSIITFRMEGTARKDADTGVTDFEARLQVLGGTGVYNNATGRGSFVGNRQAALGSPVHMEVGVKVE